MAKQRILYALFVVGAFFFFLYFQNRLSHFLLIFLLALPVFSLLAALPARWLLRYQITVNQPVVSKGEEASYTLTVSNPSAIPCGCAKLRVGCRNALGRARPDKKPDKLRLTVAPRSSGSLSLSRHFDHYGRMDLSVQRAHVCDMLGLFSLPLRRRPQQQASLYILPNPLALAFHYDAVHAVADGETAYSPFQPGDDPSEVFEIREYREGDRLRQVHWKLSQRWGRWMSKEFSLPLHPQVHFVVDFGSQLHPEQADQLLEAFTSLAAALLQQQVPVSVWWSEQALENQLIAQSDQLQEVLIRLLSLPGTPQPQALSGFTEAAPPNCRLIYFAAGLGIQGGSAIAQSASALQQQSECRITMLLDRPEGVPQTPDCRVLQLENGLTELGQEGLDL